LQVTARIHLLPAIGHKCPIDAFKCGTSAFIAPCEHATSQVELLQVGVVKKTSKLAHTSAIKA
jgi:hypothetical protein